MSALNGPATDPLTEKILATLDALPGAERWDVLPGQFSPPQTVCRAFPTAREAHAALSAAGYAITAEFVPTPPLAPLYDLQTVLRYSGGGRWLVILVRRAGS